MTGASVAGGLNREMLAKAFPSQPRLVVAFEQQSQVVEKVDAQSTENVAATKALQDATVLTLSANDTLANERVVQPGPGISFNDTGTELTIDVSDAVVRADGGGLITIAASVDVTLLVAGSGTIVTRSAVETLSGKTLSSPKVSGIGDYANDAAAAGGGVPVGGVYRNGSVLMIRAA
jgi:hypothetical protein